MRHGPCFPVGSKLSFPERTTRIKTVITYGTFDLFHIGHLRLLERAREFGDRLVVGVSTDEFNEGKGKRTVIPFRDRAAIVRAVRCVDDVFPEQSWQQKRDDLRRFGASVLVMGDDWKGKFDDLRDACEVVYLPRTSMVSTTSIKEAVALLQQIAREYTVS